MSLWKGPLGSKLFFILTAILVASSAAWYARELSPEWKTYQRRYYKLFSEKVRAEDPKRARRLQATSLRIRQIHVPALARIDRCVTCHAGVENPVMADAPQPFRTHPAVPGAHNFEEFGCTVCHQGQGQALTVEEAHGFVEHWWQPILSKEHVRATCGHCHEDADSTPGAEVLAQGKQMFKQYGCIGCHTLKGEGGNVSPDLTKTGQKTLSEFDPEGVDWRHVKGPRSMGNWIFEHFLDPQNIVRDDPVLGVPESAMPNLNLTEEQAHVLTAYVLSLTEVNYPKQYLVPGKPVPAPVYADIVERGRAVFERNGCAGCHGQGGRGGIRNKNAQGAQVPPLVYVKAGFTEEELKTTIQNGRTPARESPDGPQPPLWMPAWKEKIKGEDLDALAAYLFSLYPIQEEPQAEAAKK